MQSYDKYEKRGDIHWQKYANHQQYKEMVDDIVNKVTKTHNNDLVEIGCGDGLIYKKLQDKGLYIIGIDSSLKGIMLAKEHGCKNVYNIPAEQWFKKTRGINTLLFFDVLEHLENPESIIEKLHTYCTDCWVLNPKPKQSEYHNKEWDNATLLQYFTKFKLKDNYTYTYPGTEKTLFYFAL